ncbi:MAG: agmatinase [Thermoplasmata archaeon]|nr:agmatinase [Thermoplasmata archaeon]
MGIETLLFADAGPRDGARAALFGVPFDGTASFRPGARLGPNAIRQASYNFETYHLDLDVDLEGAAFTDVGDVEEFGSSAAMVKGVAEYATRLVGEGLFPLALGGEHSLTPPCVQALGRPGFVVLDAHMDFRDAYLDDPNSHACVTRRVVDRLGADQAVVLGLRSASKGEKEAADRLGLRTVSASRIRSEGVEGALSALDGLPERLYVSLDMDVVDPAYAPGVGNPEPFGLTPREVLGLLRGLIERGVGFDVTEVSPPWDHGQTAALAARLIRDVLAQLRLADRL